MATNTNPFDDCEIQFYGERGLVNALFLDLQACGGILELLRKFEFPFCEQPNIDFPAETAVVIIVEAGFHQFGNPDAIVIATLPDGQKSVIFLEAKVGVYRDVSQTSSAPDLIR